MAMPSPKNVFRIIVNFCLVGAGGPAIWQASHQSRILMLVAGLGPESKERERGSLAQQVIHGIAIARMEPPWPRSLPLNQMKLPALQTRTAGILDFLRRAKSKVQYDAPEWIVA